MSRFQPFTTKLSVSFSLATEGFLLQSDREARAWGGIAPESSQLIFVNLEIFNLIAANGNHILESLKKKHINKNISICALSTTRSKSWGIPVKEAINSPKAK